MSNHSSQPITWRALVAVGPSTNFLIRDSGGKEVRWDGVKISPVLLGLPTITLQPEEERQTKTLLDMNLAGKMFPNAGRYDLRVELIYDKFDGSKQRETVFTNPIAINIIEPQGANLQAFDYFASTLKPALGKVNDKELTEMKQTFVNRFPNSVYTKYLIIELASIYQQVFLDEPSAMRELCKISNENFYFTERVRNKLLEIDSKLYPPDLTPLSEDAKLPIRPDPCSRVPR